MLAPFARIELAQCIGQVAGMMRRGKSVGGPILLPIWLSPSSLPATTNPAIPRADDLQTVIPRAATKSHTVLGFNIDAGGNSVAGAAQPWRGLEKKMNAAALGLMAARKRQRRKVGVEPSCATIARIDIKHVKLHARWHQLAASRNDRARTPHL